MTMTPPPSLRDRLREATTREILDAGESVLAEHGAASASMASIAQRAGVSVGTLYNYFKDKDQLLETILCVRREELAHAMDQEASAHLDASYPDHLEAFVRSVFGLFDGYRKFLRILMEHTGQDQSRKRWLVDRLTPIVAKGVAEGRLTQNAAAIYPVLFAGAIRGVLVERMDRPAATATRDGELDLVIGFLLAQC